MIRVCQRSGCMSTFHACDLFQPQRYCSRRCGKIAWEAAQRAARLDLSPELRRTLDLLAGGPMGFPALAQALGMPLHRLVGVFASQWRHVGYVVRLSGGLLTLGPAAATPPKAKARPAPKAPACPVQDPAPPRPASGPSDKAKPLPRPATPPAPTGLPTACPDCARADKRVAVKRSGGLLYCADRCGWSMTPAQRRRAA